MADENKVKELDDKINKILLMVTEISSDQKHQKETYNIINNKLDKFDSIDRIRVAEMTELTTRVKAIEASSMDNKEKLEALSQIETIVQLHLEKHTEIKEDKKSSTGVKIAIGSLSVSTIGLFIALLSKLLES